MGKGHTTAGAQPKTHAVCQTDGTNLARSPEAKSLETKSLEARSLAEELDWLRRRVAELEADCADRAAELAQQQQKLTTISSAHERVVTDAEAQRAIANALAKRCRELRCFYGFSKLSETPGITLDGILRGTADLLPPAYQYPEYACARIELEGNLFGTDGFEAARWKQTVPLFVHGVEVGRIEVGYSQKPWQDDHEAFLSEERALLEAVAERTGRIIERRRAQDALRRRTAELEALLSASRTVLEEEEGGFARTARRLFDAVRRLIGAQSGNVALRGESGTEDEVLLPEAEGLDGSEDPLLCVPISGFRAVVCAKTRPVFENDFAHSQWARLVPPGRMSLRNLMLVPLNIDGRALGLMALANKPTDFTDEDARLAGAFGDLAAVALRNSQNLGALRSSETKYRALFSAVGQGFSLQEIILDANGVPIDYVTLEVNRAFEEILGASADQVEGKRASEILPPDELDRWLKVFGRVALQNETARYEQYSPLNKKHFRGYAFCPRPGQFAVVFDDITERKNAEEENIRMSENAPALLCTARADGTFEKINREWTRVLGFSSEELLQMGYASLIHPDDREATLAETQRLLAGNPTAHFVNRYRARDGSYRTLEWCGTPALDGRLYACARDITERRRADEEKARLEEQLRNAQKMEAIDTLAGGVAHDFNNILGGVLGGLSLLELDLEEGAENLRADIQDMKELVQRGADLAKQLLGLSRRGKHDVRPLDLASIAKKTSTMFGRARRDLAIEHDFAPDLRAVLMDHTQLEQVLLNLLLNAGQAMPDGGRLVLRAENAGLPKNELEGLGAAPGQFVKLVVADTGVGMDAATQARIFEPFFTTRAAGKGSGLGLASVYGIVKNHGGIVTVDSELGKGTAFTIFLPATEMPITEKTSPPQVTRTGQGTVLVVDDEEAIRNVCTRALRKIGFEVLTAAGGRAAIDLLQQHRDRISLVLLDLTMPEMSGAKTYEAIRRISPTVKVLLASGFAEDGHAQELLARGCNGFIQKPFDVAALSEKVLSWQ